jgi:OTU domain-containing protein 5
VSEDFDDYLARKRRDKVFGNHLELQAISELYNRRIEIYDVEEFGRRSDAKPKNVFQNEYKGAPIRLSYHDRNHYNSIVDPNDPRIGEGLLPDYKTREQIEHDLIRRVKEVSDRDQLENELGRFVEEESIREDEERLLRELEERQVKEILSKTRPIEYFDWAAEYDAALESEEKTMERVIWESLRER